MLTAGEKSRMRRKAIEANTTENWGDDGDNFHEHATPDAVISLLDEIETRKKKLAAAKKQIAELEARTLILPPAVSVGGQGYRDQVVRLCAEAGINVQAE